MGSEEGGAFDTPQMKAMMLSYPSQMVSWLGLQLRVTTFSIKVCVTNQVGWLLLALKSFSVWLHKNMQATSCDNAQAMMEIVFWIEPPCEKTRH